ncbi:hypothetical protein DL95DRAFT_412259 [Leptodontidium sp. 2 PMI_412]|nr:hypothetical protein DL95DRAFT_412259 [Leptodontidium sp. 2 PMI_412]
MWYITKDDAHWKRSTTILDPWGSNLTNIIGTDRSLMVGLDGDLFVNAAEIMRWEGGWVEQGAKWQGGSGFSIQLYWLFARQSVIIGQANYGIASIKALLSFAVYLDDVAMYSTTMLYTRTRMTSVLASNPPLIRALANLLNPEETKPRDDRTWGASSPSSKQPRLQSFHLREQPAAQRIRIFGKDLWTLKATQATDALGGKRRVTANDMPSRGDLIFATEG